MSRTTRGLTAFLALFLPTLAAGQQAPSYERGFDPEKVYQLGDLDSVNILNGNLVLTLPIGDSRPVSSALGYGLQLVYNAKAWDHEESGAGGVQYVKAVPDRLSNSGLGWSLSLGRLLEPNDPVNDANRWVYVGADGADHVLYPTLHAGDPEPTNPTTFYARDSSYLRLRTTSSTTRVVDLPSGHKHIFSRFGTFDWRLTSLRDPFEAASDIAVSYSMDGNTWAIADRHGRTQTVKLKADPAGFYPRVVDQVSLTAFGGATATYTFNYQAPTIHVPCSSTLPDWTSVKVPVLSSIGLPDGSSFVFTYNTATNGGTCFAWGTMASMTLPTLGKVKWTYGIRTLPIEGCSQRQWLSNSAAVATRELLDAGNVSLGKWTYTATLSTWPPPDSRQCETGVYYRRPPEELTVTVLTPLKDKTVHHFSVWPGSYFAETTAFDVAEYGLPLTRAVSDSTGARFLSTEVYDCDASGTVCGSPKRSTYVRYERDPIACAPEFVDCPNANRRLASERTVYHDDAPGGVATYADLDRSGYDGFGNYRTVRTGGNFGAGDVRTVFTNYNPGNVLPGTAWILGTYTDESVTEGPVTAKRETCFDAATGALTRERILKGAAQSSTDVVVASTRNVQGDVTRVDYFGAVAGGVPSGSLCSLLLPQSAYRLDHTYQYGSLATSTYVDAAGIAVGPAVVNRTIDQRTGLAASSADLAGLVTSFEYDASGRLTWVKPALGHGGWTEYVYTRATSAAALASASVRRRDNGAKTAAVLAESETRYDAFGRLTVERRLMPSGVWSRRETLYDGMGHRTSVSELQAEPVTTPKVTLFSGLDAFGRPASVTAPDGTSVNFTYAGERAVTRTSRVGTTWNGSAVTQSNAVTTEEYDRQGRLRAVTDPSGPLGELITTKYEHDVGGRLKKVCQAPVNGVCGQSRFFTYDNRGFLTSEQHPEKGAAGNGLVTYQDYDARGHATRVVDGTSTLTFVYDRAERLTAVNGTGGVALKRFTYSNANTAGDYSAGKITKAERYNYADLGGVPYTIRVEELYTYGGRDGRPSLRTTKFWIGGSNTDNFSQSFSYDALGNVTALGYPSCVSCGVSSPRTVSNTYTQGLLTAIPGYASSLSYHPNGLLDKVQHSNGIADVHGADPNGMLRPQSITAKVAATSNVLWSSGAYNYDTSGNITQIGGSHFEYSKGSRLMAGTVFTTPTGGGTEQKQSYTYDQFGNILSITTKVGTAAATVRNTPTALATNRLTGTGTTYDARGNLTQWNGAATYQYDELNRMTRMTSGGEDWIYVYTADDERLFSYKVGPTRNNRWTLRDLGGRVLREYTQATTWTVERDYVYRGSALLAAATPQGTRHFHLDHLGTPRAITDTAGTRLAYHVYYPYGEEATSPTLDTERMKFTGHERDLGATSGTSPAADDVDYMHARFCSPLTARFLTTDPAIDSARPSVPTTWNRYSYVLDSPLTYVDPYGEKWFRFGEEWEYLDGVDIIENIVVTEDGTSTSEQVAGYDALATFDGDQLVLYRPNGSTVSLAATSGRLDANGRTQPLLQRARDVGPVPEGEYSIDPAEVQEIGLAAGFAGFANRGTWPGGVVAWGTQRVFLRPSPDTQTFGRSGFAIHGGAQSGSRGCIDLCHGAKYFFLGISDATQPIPVFVKYRLP